MQPFPIVKDLDVGKQTLSQLLPIPIPFSVHPFRFQRLEKGLRDRIVIAVTFAAHALYHLVLLQSLSERFACILHTPIRVQNYSRRWLTMQKRHVQGNHNGAVRRQSVAERVTDNLPVEQIQNYGQVVPTAIRSQIGNITAPDFIGDIDGKILSQKILCNRLMMIAICCHLELSCRSGSNTQDSHQPCYSGAAAPVTPVPQHLGNPGTAIRFMMLLMNGFDLFHQFSVFCASTTFSSLCPSIIAADRNTKHATQASDSELIPMLLDKPVFQGVVLVNTAQAFLRNSYFETVNSNLFL